MKKILVILITLVLLSVTFYVVLAGNDSCVIHRGRELWINHHAVPAHLRHGDRMCPNQNPEPTEDSGTPVPNSTETFLESSGKEDIVKVTQVKYENKILTLTWIGYMESVRICDKQMNCWTFEPPTEYKIISHNEKRGSIIVGLEKGTYFVYGNNQYRKTGNDGERKFVIK